MEDSVSSVREMSLYGSESNIRLFNIDPILILIFLI